MTEAVNDGQGVDQAEGQGGGAAAWYGDAHKDIVGAKQWQDPDSVIESYVNLEKLFGADKAGRTIVIPKDENDQEGLKAFRAKIGVPESADGYELGGEGEFAKTAAGWFHANGIPKAAGQALAKAWSDHFSAQIKAQDEAAQAESQKALEALKGEWGQDFEKRSEFARRGLKAYGEKAGLDEHDLTGLEQVLGTAKMLRMFHALGETTGEATFAGGQGSGALSPHAAKQKMEEIREKRIKGEIGEKDFMAAMDLYGPLAAKAS